MVADHRAQVEELLADYRRSRDQLAAVQQELASLSETVRSEDGTVQVTVGPHGALRDLTINHAAYQRYPAAQLSRMILQLTRDAEQAVARRAGDVLAPVLPAGTDPAAVLDGRADLEPAVPERNESPPPDENHDEDDDEDDEFSDESWLQSTTREWGRR